MLQGLTIGESIGRGGFAIVWGATRDEDGAAVAIKVGHADTPHTSERFKRDAEAMRHVGPPYTPHVYASGRLADGRPYIAMERIAGSTLAARIAQIGAPHDLHAAIATASAVLDALCAAHARGIVHRDLKPDNIIFDLAGRRATLIDFGLAKSVAPTAWDITRPGTVIGTSEYMAPEQLRGEAVDERTDIYAFGVILFQLLTGRRPFEGDVASIEHGHLVLRPPRPSDLAPVPEGIEALVLACLAKEPARRPESAAWLKGALDEAWRAASAADEVVVTSETTRTQPRTAAPRNAKLLAESQRPMVVLVAEVAGPAVQVSEVVAKRNGFIARQHGPRCTCVFSGTDAANPIEAAIATARELIERFGGRAALHLAALTLRPQEGGPPAVYGRAVERPETWLPKGPYRGLVISPELARSLPEEELAPAPTSEAFVELSVTAPDAPAGPLSSPTASSKEPFSASISTSRQIPLFGQQPLVDAMAASARASFEAKSPGLVTILGDHGAGKTRLAGEAAGVASRVQPNAQIVVLRASPPIAGESAPTARKLLAWLLAANTAMMPADPKAHYAERLRGAANAEEMWPAIAGTLGWPGGNTDSTETTDFTVMRAIVEGLRQKALEGPVAVVLDDAQWADDIALDALENAALEADGCPLWVVMTAHPRFESVRRWGSRAERHERLEIAPLPEADAMKLAAELLLPVEYPPAAILSRIAAWAGGNPACLVDLVRALKRAGIVKRRPTTGSYYVATAELEQLPPQPAWQWLAVRRLDGLPPELAACVRLCAVLGVRFSREEVERVQDAIDRAGEAGTPVDVGVGLGALADLKILERAGERWAFQSAAFQDAVYKLLEPAHRRRIHQRAFEVWQAWLGERDTSAAIGRVERTTWTGDWEQSGEVVERTSWFDDWEQGAGEAPNAEGDPPARLEGRPGALRAHRKDALERIARHAGACGATAHAADAHLALAEAAMTSSRHVEADHHYTAALSFLAEGDTRARALALSKRARARYRLYRVSDALDDLRAARSIAARLGERGLEADTLLEEATALDHANAHAESAERVEEARAIVEGLRDPALMLRYMVALGRSRWRQERVPEAIELLSRGADGARRSGDYDTRVVALLLLSCALSVGGRIDEAVKRYIEVIELCMQAEDRLHLGMAYLNRVFLWLVRKSPAESIPDLRRAIQLAREVGNPWLERAATANTAEILHWSGSHDEAAALARRSCVLAERFVERPVYEDRLLLARIQLMRGQYGSARASIGQIVARCPATDATPKDRALFRTIELVLAELGGPAPLEEGDAPERGPEGAADGPPWGGGGGWEDVLEDAKSSLFAEELLEILYWRTRTALHGGRAEEAEAAILQAREPLASCPSFHERFNALIGQLPTAAAS